MRVIVRPFAPADRPSLWASIDAVCGEGRWMDTTRFEPTPEWRRALDTPAGGDHLLLVAADGEQAVGWCRLFPVTEKGSGCPESEIGIGLLSAYRGQGLGREMLGQALNWAEKRGVEQVTLTTHLDNHRAIRLFQHYGFQEIDRRQDGRSRMTCPILLSGGEGNG